MTRPIASWLRECFPAIDPQRPSWGADVCWIALTMTMSAEHNPPLYWLGRAFDVMADDDAAEVIRARLEAAHGGMSCGGDRTRDDGAQDVLSEACAFAWARAQLGPVCFEPLAPGSTAASSAVQLVIPALDVRVAPVRLSARRSMREAIEGAAAAVRGVAERLPPARGRVVYLDTWHAPHYAQGVGYRIELTDPLREVLRQVAQEHGLGRVLTRPFQWGNPIDAQY